MSISDEYEIINKFYELKLL